MMRKLSQTSILQHLAECTAKNWLGDSHSQELLDLTEKRLKRLRSLQLNSTTKLNIFVVETEPVKFMSALLAGIIAKVDIFLCNPNWQEQEWHQVLNLVEPDVIFADETIKKLITEIKASCHNSVKQQILSNEECAIMIPTGGTSGKIKFAIHSLSTLTASVIGFCDYFKTLTVNSFCLLPLYHVSGLMQFFRSFLTQGRLYIMPYKVLKQDIKVDIIIQDFFISLVPTQLQFLIESNPLWLAKFQTVLLGGAPATRSLLNKSREYNIPLAPTYGMTETASQIVTLKPDDFLKGNNSSGKILPHARITIVDDCQNKNNNKKVGIINIKSDSLCLGYYPDLFSQSKTFVTDDLGWFDSQGYLHIVGRNSHTIITGGEKVFPTEVEAAILATKLVTEVCVIGISDRKWGKIVTALYVPTKLGYNRDLIKQQLQAKISKYKHPKYWIEVEQIPHSDRGKIDYQQVKSIAQYWLEKQSK